MADNGKSDSSGNHQSKEEVFLRHVCDVCKKRFKIKSLLHRHYRMHTAERPEVCHLCNKRLKHKSSLRLHMLRHDNTRSFICNVCNKGLSGKKELKRHLNSHMGVMRHFCDVCDKGFLESHNLKNHRWIHFDHGKRFYMCVVCNAILNFADNLKEHMRLHSESTVQSRDFLPVAENEISSLTYQNDVISVSQNENLPSIVQYDGSIPISDCSITTTPCASLSSSTLKENLNLTKVNSSQYAMVVNDCLSSASQNKNLSLDQCDISNFTTENLILASGVPPKALNTKNVLTNLLCNVCGQKFSTKSLLQEHHRTRTCEKSVAQNENLSPISQHNSSYSEAHDETLKSVLESKTLNSIEQVVFPYMCYVCNKQFKIERSLEKHYRTCVGRKSTAQNENSLAVSQGNGSYLTDHNNTLTLGSKLKTSDSKEKINKSENSSTMTQINSSCLVAESEVVKSVSESETVHCADEALLPHVCDVCSKRFKKKSVLKTHYIKHSGQKPEICHLCNKRFTYKTSLKEHLLRHADAKRHVCYVCKKGFVTKKDMQRHLGIHQNEEAFIQTKSVFGEAKLDEDKEFDQNRNLSPMAQSNGSCLAAGNEAESQTPRAILEGLLPYVCDVCNKRFSLKWLLERHYRKHTGERPETCHVCSKSFSCKGNLAKHSQVHAGDKKKNCHTGGKKRIRRTGGKKKNSHIGEKKDIHDVWCEACNKFFVNKYSLREHMLRHNNARTFICHICQKGFNGPTELRRHLASHQGLKRHFCDVCNKGFSALWYLKIHRRKNKCKLDNLDYLNTNGEPNSGKLCSKDFKAKSKVKRHRMTRKGKELTAQNVNSSPMAQSHSSYLTEHNETLTSVTQVEPSKSKEKNSENENSLPMAQINCLYLIVYNQFLTPVTQLEPSNSKEKIAENENSSPMAQSNCLYLTKHNKTLTPVTQLKASDSKVKFTENENLSTISQINSSCLVAENEVAKSVGESKTLHATEEASLPHVCYVCNKQFKTEIRLKEHYKMHKGVKPEVCRLCCKRFVTKANLDQHLLRHANARSYVCDLCKKSFNAKKDLWKHLTTQRHKEASRRAKLLFGQTKLHETKESKTKESVQIHYLSPLAKTNSSCLVTENVAKESVGDSKPHCTTKEASLPHVCYVCSKQFETQNRLKEHYKMHKGVKPEVCTLCSKRFVSKANLNEHLLRHANAKSHVCYLCKKAFNAKKDMQKHLVMHWHKEAKTKSVVGQTTLDEVKESSQSQISSAMSKTNSSSLGTENGCKKSVPDSKTLQASEEAPGRHMCDTCGVRFKHQSVLEVHYRFHTGEKPEKCNLCGKCFYTKGLLNSHYKNHHAGEKKDMCNLCNKRFVNRYSLRDHMLRHADARPFVCDVCQRGFNGSNELRRHVVSHLGVKGHFCNVCKKGFSSLWYLKNHRRKKKCKRDIKNTREKPKSLKSVLNLIALKAKRKFRKHMLPLEDTSYLVCRLCYKSFEKPHPFRLHTSKCTGPKVTIFKECCENSCDCKY